MSATGQPRRSRNARASAEVGWRAEPAPSVDRRTAHQGRCALRCVGNVSALQIRRPSSNGRGVGDAAPYGLCDRVRFCGAVRCSLPAPVTFHAATFVSLLPVRGGVLDAPRSDYCRGGLGAAVRRGRLHPRHLRRARLRLPPHVSNPAGTARAPFVRREENRTRRVVCRGVCLATARRARRRCPSTRVGAAAQNRAKCGRFGVFGLTNRPLCDILP